MAATLASDPADAERAAHVLFAQPQEGVSPGQAAVFYRGDEVLGGGWIRRALTLDEAARERRTAAAAGGEPCA